MGGALLASLPVPALVGWALCGATIAVTAPMIFAAASFAYFSRAPFTTPLQTATIYVALVMVLDVAVVATFIERSYAMFASILGTWLPFALIFGATYLVGAYVTR